MGIDELVHGIQTDGFERMCAQLAGALLPTPVREVVWGRRLLLRLAGDAPLGPTPPQYYPTTSFQTNLEVPQS